MATFAITALYLNLGSNDLTDHIRKAELKLEGAALPSATMGDTWEEFIMGLKSGSLSWEALDDFAVANLDSIVWGFFNTGTAVTFEIRATNSAVSTSNPKYTGSFLPNKYGLGGSLGEMAMKSLEYPTTGAVARATS